MDEHEHTINSFVLHKGADKPYALVDDATGEVIDLTDPRAELFLKGQPWEYYLPEYVQNRARCRVWDPNTGEVILERGDVIGFEHWLRIGSLLDEIDASYGPPTNPHVLEAHRIFELVGYPLG